MSQVFDIGPSCCFIKCRKFSFKYSPKSFFFYILYQDLNKKNLRHGSLHLIGINKLVKIKVKK